jgi:hypothetical protein
VTRRYSNYSRVKKLRSYTVHEIGTLLKIHKNTVHHWIKQGLPTVDDKRPFLVLGYCLIHFLQERRSKRQRPCGENQMYCFRCRAVKNPAGSMADYIPLTDKLGNLSAICPDCNSIMHKVTSIAKLDQISQKLDIIFPQAPRRLINSYNPCVISEKEQEGQDGTT